jgi:hypothetical protein
MDITLIGFFSFLWSNVETHPITFGAITGFIYGIILNIDEKNKKKEEQNKILNVRIVND